MQLVITDTAPAHFIADIDRVAKSLRPHTFTHEGAEWVEPTAPPKLVELQRELTSMGLLGGWLTYTSQPVASASPGTPTAGHSSRA